MKILESTQYHNWAKYVQKDTYHKPIWVTYLVMKTCMFWLHSLREKNVLMNPVINDVGEGKIMNLAMMLYI
jgi:hypothetical protein